MYFYIDFIDLCVIVLCMYVPDLNMYPVLWCNCIQLFQKVFLEKNKQASSSNNPISNNCR